MKRRLLNVLAGATAAVIVLSACSNAGTSEAPSDSAKASGAASGSASPLPSSTSVNLQIGTIYGPTTPQGAALKSLTDKYTSENPNVKFTFEMEPEDQLTSLLAQSVANAMPDIVLIDPSFFPGLATTGKLQDLSSLVQGSAATDYLKGAIEGGTGPDGALNGLFIGTNTLAIFYNKDLFKQAGIESIPKTWDPFLETMRTLKSRGIDPFMFSAKNAGGCSMWQFDAWRWSAGGSDTTFADSGNIAALEYWTNLVKSGLVSKDVVNTCQDTDTAAFAHGDVAMVEEGPWVMSTFDDAKINYGVFPIPVPTADAQLVVPLGGELWTLPKTADSAREAAALAFLKWSQSPELVTEVNGKMGYIPVLKSTWQEFEEAHPALTPFINSLENARSRTTGLGARLTAQQNAFGTAIQQALLGQATPQDALTAAQSAFDQAKTGS